MFFTYYFKIFAILFANTNNYFYLCQQRIKRSAESRPPLSEEDFFIIVRHNLFNLHNI